MKRIEKIIPLFLALFLLGGLFPAPVRAEEETVIVIDSAADFLRFAGQCSLDTWSRGKTVRLEADIELVGRQFRGIPSFGGRFLGNGHIVYGLALEESGSAIGLFRYIQSGAVVEHLTVTGTVRGGSGSNQVGGIAGANAGTILGCTFQGEVRGESLVGGIAGFNDAGGEIADCGVSGTVNALSAAGGVAGKNQGNVRGCKNAASVNTEPPEFHPLASGLTEGDLLSDILNGNGASRTESLLNLSSDAGGIAGLSYGGIYDCENSGEVGYPHVGYNNGGIAGRQGGYISGCANTGAIHGRKDVGGIVGQAEPDITVSGGYSTLSRLKGQLDEMSTLIDQAIDHTDASREDIHRLLQALSGSTAVARDSVQILMDESGAMVDSNLDAANDLGEALKPAADRAGNAMDALSSAAGTMDEESDNLQRAAERLADALNGRDAATLRTDMGKLNSSIGAMESELDRIRAGVDALRAAAENRDLSAAASAAEEVRTAVSALAQTVSDVQSATAALRQDLDKLRTGNSSLGTQLYLDMEDSLNQLDGLWTSLDRIGSELSAAADALGAAGDVSPTPFSDAARQSSAGLFAALTDMSSQAESLWNALDGTGDALSDDLRAVNRQINAIFHTATDAAEDAGTISAPDELIEDASDVNIASIVSGKIEGSGNGGAIDGDRNAGGIVGSMAIEYELDPENDLTGSIRYGDVFQTRAVAVGCVNRGEVRTKKDCAGGIAGQTDLGTLYRCENYGAVGSTDGSYAGGIAGLSGGVIRSCWSKCTVSAASYAGGIAGKAEQLRDCRAIAAIDGSGSSCSGAVAGDAALENARGNLFLNLGLAGIDGISYAGIAEPAEFEALRNEAEVPEEFLRFTLFLQADGETVGSIPFAYGQDLSGLALPDIPEKEDCYAVWPEFDRTGKVSDLRVEAVYTPWITLLPSAEREGERALVLAEGEFTGEASLSAVPDPAAPPDGVKNASVLRVALHGSGLGASEPLRLRFLNTAARRAALWQYLDGGWQRLDAAKNGSYLVAEVAGTEGLFCVSSANSLPAWVLPAAGGGALCLALAVSLAARARRKKRRAAAAAAAEEAKVEQQA
ncbi:MAG: hypothetical protein IJ617_00590 [Oscillospiraceae bacterium]|nr:hypothetical protein [Oscillospiraceae bacterium]